VSTCRHTGQPLVLLQAEGRDRWLAFYLPMNEANRLARPLILAGRGYFFVAGHWPIGTRAIGAYLLPAAGLKIVASPSLLSSSVVDPGSPFG